jgi:phytoene/squalene synthetase
MCLAIFCEGKKSEYYRLSAGAKRLGAAYQKINFLRDLASDSDDLGRIYFPNLDLDKFTENSKNEIIKNINKDLDAADESLSQLPTEYRKAVLLSRLYYGKLLSKIENTPAKDLKDQRIRINNFYKIMLLIRVIAGEK